MRQRCMRTLTLALLLLTTLAPARAATTRTLSWEDGTPAGAEMAMCEIMVPAWTDGTFYACWSGGGNVGPGYQGGIRLDAQRPGQTSLVWEFSPVGGELSRCIYTHPRLSVAPDDSGKVEGPWPLKAESWYRMVMRFWDPPAGTLPNTTYAGWWMKDIDANEWYLLAAVSLPRAKCRFLTNGGFLEEQGGGAKPAEAYLARNYSRTNGVWQAGAWTFRPAGDGGHTATALAPDEKSVHVEASSRPFEGSTAATEVKGVTLTQPAQPGLDPPVLFLPKATLLGTQVGVAWSPAPKSAPQFRYRIEVFPHEDPSENPLAAVEVVDPTATRCLLNLPSAVPSAFVRVTLTDIFDKKTSALVACAPGTPLPASGAEGSAEPGLDARFYQADTAYRDPAEGENWQAIPDLDQMTVVARARTAGLDLSARPREFGYAARFRGYLQVPSAGLYILRLRSCDGSRLYLDGQLAVDNDGVHGAWTRDSLGALAAGTHELRIEYFKNWADGADELGLEWEGPGIARSPVPASALLRAAGAQ
jgi:hypothetical protein